MTREEHRYVVLIQEALNSQDFVHKGKRKFVNYIFNELEDYFTKKYKGSEVLILGDRKDIIKTYGITYNGCYCNTKSNFLFQCFREGGVELIESSVYRKQCQVRIEL